MGNLLYRVYRVLGKHRIIAAIGLLATFSCLAFLASRITFEEDISKLIPIHADNRDLQKVLETVHFADKIVVHITTGAKGSTNDLTTYAGQLLDSIDASSSPLIKDIQGVVNDDGLLEVLDFAYDHLPQFLDTTDYRAIRQRLAVDSVHALVREHYKTLMTPTGGIARKQMVKDPLGLTFLALKKLRPMAMGDGFRLADGFLVSEDGKHLLLFLTPAYATNDTDHNEALANALYRIRDALNTDFENRAQTEYFGGALVAVANAQQIKNDIRFTVGIAVGVLLLILVLFYKRATVPLILFIPTLFGGLLAMAFLYLYRDHISAISLGIGSVLLGITLDYALHILTHIRNGKSMDRLFHEVAPSIIMSSLTTAAAFLCLLFLEAQALQDLGIFAAVSVLGASVFALLFIPQVYAVTQTAPTRNTLLDRLAGFDFHKSKILITALVTMLIVAGFTQGRVGFEKDIAQLNFEPQELVTARNNLDALTHTNSKSVYLVAYAPTLEKALETNENILARLQILKNGGQLLGFSSIGNLVLPAKIQQERIDDWKNFWTVARRDSLQKNLETSASSFGFKPGTFAPFYAFTTSEFQPIPIDGYRIGNGFSMDDYIGVTNDMATVSTLVKLNSDDVPHIKAAFSEMPGALVIDRQGMSESFLGHLKGDFNHLILYSVVAVFVLLLLFFRSLSLTLVTAIPIGLSWILTTGVMGALGLEFNIFNIIISTFVFGLGVDYCIFVTTGLLIEYTTGEKALPTHRTSIILSVLTTVLGIGVMIFAKHPALHSISVVSLIGIFSAALIAFTLQPLIFRLFIGSRTKRPTPLRYMMTSFISLTLFTVGGMLFSLYAFIALKLFPKTLEKKHMGYRRAISSMMTSVLYSNPFVRKKILNEHGEDFKKPAVIIANHTSSLDSLSIWMLTSKALFFVNDWVYHSPIFGHAARMTGAYPVAKGIREGLGFIARKTEQGLSPATFPEGKRSNTNKIGRFHKGAFLLAQELNLDVLPVFIHGNAEVMPKDSFVIRDGEIVLKVMPRIPFDDPRFKGNARTMARVVSKEFRTGFDQFRREREGATYFHKAVLEDFRYKGHDLFSRVRKDLNERKDDYKTIMDTVGPKAQIVHLGGGNGQLDFLLAMDAPDRRIIRYCPDRRIRKIIGNSYITHRYGNIRLEEDPGKALETGANTLILHYTPDFPEATLDSVPGEIATFIVLIDGPPPANLDALARGFSLVKGIPGKDGILILKKNNGA